MKFDPPSTTTPRVLIVEDELIVSADIAARLERMGYQVVGQADQAEQAVKICLEQLPDLVLMDIRLKGDVDGIAAASRIRSSCSIPIVFLTAHADESTLQRAKITEPYGYILKPFEERELRIVVEVSLYRSKIDRQLAQSREFLATILQSINDAVIACDDSWCVSYINPAAEQLIGSSADQVLQKPINQVLRIMQLESKMPISAEDLASQSNSTGDEFFLRVHGDMLRRVVLNTSRLKLRAGSADDASVFMLRDVTKQRILEESLLQSHRMESLGQLAAGIAHDLNNLLTVVCINSGLLFEMPSANTTQRELLQDINKATERATTMTQQLLAIGKKQVVQSRTIDLNALVQSRMDLLNRLVSPKVSTRLEIHANPLEIHAESVQIEQVLFNLAINARKRLSEGGVLTIRTLKLDHFAQLNDQPVAVLEVEDNGKGIDADTQARIWEPFYADNRDGTGLELAVVYGIVKQFGGTVSLTSEFGMGSVFRICLPLHDSN